MSREIRPSDAVPDTILQIAGGVLGLTGVCAFLVAVQFLLWWIVPPAETYALYTMLVSGLATMGIAWFVADGRLPAVILGCLVAPALALFGAGWALWCLSYFSFTLFMFITPLLGGLATLVLPFAIPSARRCTAARAQIGDARFGMG